MTESIRIRAALTLCASLLVAGTAWAQSPSRPAAAKSADYIVAIVNNELVTQVEVEQRVSRIRVDAMRSVAYAYIREHRRASTEQYVPGTISFSALRKPHIAAALAAIPTQARAETLHHVLELTLSGESFFPWEGAVGETPAARGLPEAAERAAGEQPDLTERQREILLLVAQGKSNKEIARALDILEGTVKAHLRFLMKHLNAKNRTQLAVMASKLS